MPPPAQNAHPPTTLSPLICSSRPSPVKTAGGMAGLVSLDAQQSQKAVPWSPCTHCSQPPCGAGCPGDGCRAGTRPGAKCAAKPPLRPLLLPRGLQVCSHLLHVLFPETPTLLLQALSHPPGSSKNVTSLEGPPQTTRREAGGPVLVPLKYFHSCTYTPVSVGPASISLTSRPLRGEAGPRIHPLQQIPPSLPQPLPGSGPLH